MLITKDPTGPSHAIIADGWGVSVAAEGGQIMLMVSDLSSGEAGLYHAASLNIQQALCLAEGLASVTRAVGGRK